MAGVGSALPAVSVAVTWKTCEPTPALPANGDAHGEAGLPSSEQRKLDASLAEKAILNFALCLLVFTLRLGAESTWVSGGSVSRALPPGDSSVYGNAAEQADAAL